MLRLYTLWELERELSPDEFHHILTPDAALEKPHFPMTWTIGIMSRHQLIKLQNDCHLRRTRPISVQDMTPFMTTLKST